MSKIVEPYKLIIKDNTYVSLYYGDKFIVCYDNDWQYGEDIINAIEKRTKMNFYDIPVEMKRDFTGFRFYKLRGFHSFYSDEVRALIKK